MVELPALTARLKRLERLIPWRMPSESVAHANGNELPLRAELYNVEQLKQHAASVAALHQLASGRGKDKLISRLRDNERVLVETYGLVAAAVARNRRIAPAAEWLIDNFYLIEEQIRVARRHLPRAYSRELPRLASGSAADYPRVYGLVLELVSHVDGRVDAASLGGFVDAYQSVAPLKLGELWAVPIMLRLALIENLRRVGARIASGRRDRNQAADWAETMLHVVEKNPTDLVLVLADMARADLNLSGAFLAELTRHLQGQSPHLAFANNWLEHRLSDQGQTVERLVQADGQAQAADQVSIGNSISSLRFISATDWREFVETHSVVDKALRDDPTHTYPAMDFNTRDSYRHVVEEIAKRSAIPEQSIAQRALELARAKANSNVEDRPAHVGYYLIGRGRPALERAAGARPSLSALLARIGRGYPLLMYIGSVLLITATATLGLLELFARHSRPVAGLYWLIVPVLFCASQLAIGLFNSIATIVVKPRPLPRLSLRDGILPELRTVVVVPTMLSRLSAIEKLLDDLEVRYLANRDANLHFILLTDYEDAPQETLPADEELLGAAREGIEALNEKYQADRTDIFFLLHRPRLWNPREGVWMGYERKRGKLAELNAFLRGRGEHRFSAIVGQTKALRDVRYVITLDTDTQLPRESARQMIGAMAHPLNRPVLAPHTQRVIDGYGILQPRIGVSLLSAQRSWFVRLFAGEAGIDPYTRTVSDVYQDVFGEGSFIGKGIYEIDAFERTCGNFPENTILSHDLLEGAHARSGLQSDVELYEEYPARYLADVSRRHRWIRGDWQILAWLLPRAPGLAGRRDRNPISALSWWKIFDNLRRSLMPPMLLAVIVGSLWLRFAPGLFFVFAAMAITPLLSVLWDIPHKPGELPLVAHLRQIGSSAVKHFLQWLFTLAALPYEAYTNLDAIARTLFRMFWSKHRLLEWKTSSAAQRDATDTLVGHIRTMWITPASAILLLILLAMFHRAALPLASPFLASWILAPGAAWWLSRRIVARAPRLSTEQRRFLALLTRKTWRYFEVFVSDDDNWLPPDNVQQRPTRIAARTSPTNIGMALLANLSAYDFGYCAASTLLDRTARTLATMQRMEKYRGHFYNWYDTRTLKPLPVEYVSTVDSGNLAGHLLVLRQGLLELIDAPLLAAQAFKGLRDTAGVLAEAAGDTSSPIMLRQIEEMESAANIEPAAVSAAAAFLNRFASSVTQVNAALPANAENAWWVQALQKATADHLQQLVDLAAWSALPAPPHEIDASNELRQLLAQLDVMPTLRAVAGLELSFVPKFDALVAKLADEHLGLIDWCSKCRQAVLESSQRAAARISRIHELAAICHELADMDFTFLFDKKQHLFSIGYNVRDHRLDGSFYDLLASEARLGSYIAIAQDQVDNEHWFALGRLLTSTGGETALLSWSGSMFEYLMPLLVMPTYDNTLLDETTRAAVHRQIKYGKQRGVPWGISESGYNTVDQAMNYQYRAFGVPGLGLKRGLAEDLVVAPYASVMALMVAPEAACKNLQRLGAQGQLGAYGLYEAVDYTPARLPPGTSGVTIRQFMAHHEGMSLLSLEYLLLGKPMQRRFKADTMLRASDLLLQERVPKAAAPVYPHALEASATRSGSAEEQGSMRVITDPAGPVPEVHLLSNGNYHVVITSAGGGYSRWRDLAITRWREDATRDCWGTFCYLRDVNSGAYWSTAAQPTLKPTKNYEAIFSQARAEFRRRDQGIETHTEITVSPEDDVEVRRITITNRSETIRTIELTSYCEVVIANPAQDLAHQAFSNLFVQTELVRPRRAILCTRRPRSAQEKPPWMVHLLAYSTAGLSDPSFETDRMKFIGRQKTVANPDAMERAGALSNSEGPVLDPVACIRQVVRLKPHESVRMELVTGMAETREAVTHLMDKYHDPNLADRAFELAWTHSQVQLRQINASEANAQAYGRLAGSMIYASAARRARPATLARNRRGQSGLWGYGISGDLPIILVRIRNRERLELVRQAIQAHAYWRSKGLITDLVIWNEDDSIYRQSLQDAIVDLVASSQQASLMDKPGGVFVRRGEQMSEDDRVLLQTVARVVLFDEAGTLIEQVERRGRSETLMPTFTAVYRRRPEPPTAAEAPQRDLALFNGLGGFSHDGREYIIVLSPGQSTPAPWANVLANSEFGTVVSDGGSVYTWSGNSHEYRLTPWNNDPVSDVSGEAIYIRDEESGRFFSPTPQPARGPMPYVVRHGFGYSVYEYEDDGIASELSIHVAIDAPVKFARVRLTNRSGRARRLSVTGYWEWVLGELRNKSLMHVVTELDPVSGAIFARNAYSAEFAGNIAFVDCSEAVRSVTGDRTEFLGRNGALDNPAAMRRARLSGRVGAGLDPCAAMQVQANLEPGQTKDIIFILGAAANVDQARQWVHRFNSVGSAQHELQRVWDYWNHTLGALYVETPDPAVNFLVNGWLIYQVLASRMWARTGFYQSGGAFGFRDQLQDAMALVHAEPRLLREQLLRAARHQFREGDVLHWWHPPAGRGVRTHFSDDFLWLPFALCRYVRTTGDTGILEERAPFLSGRPVRPEEDAYYDLPNVSDDIGTLYEHARRAIENGLRYGEHGLPLMGCGDWNDGMNLVGEAGKGESVWLAFFLYDVLNQFVELAQTRGDEPLVDRYSAEAAKLRQNIELHGWDGNWYLRAFFDNGDPIGSASNPECQIDALPQSWAVLSKAGPPDRCTTAMDNAIGRLVRRDARLIKLLDPPFDHSAMNPGYIKGYVPGVRENGGQYTHAAIWTVMATAALGNANRAWELFAMINPLNHGATEESIATYRVEPYVVAADVYAVSPHTGRGGWTWYTGSAGWMYRLITESLLGITLDIDKLHFSPRLPAGWKPFKIHYRYRETFYHIELSGTGSGSMVQRIERDGAELSEKFLPMVDDRVEHVVQVHLT